MSKGTTRTPISTRPSDAVVRAVSEAAGVEPLDLDVPLYEAVDPDALDALFEGRDTDELVVSFTYGSYDVTIDDEHCYVEERP